MTVLTACERQATPQRVMWHWPVHGQQWLVDWITGGALAGLWLGYKCGKVEKSACACTLMKWRDGLVLHDEGKAALNGPQQRVNWVNVWLHFVYICSMSLCITIQDGIYPQNIFLKKNMHDFPQLCLLWWRPYNDKTWPILIIKGFFFPLPHAFDFFKLKMSSER